MQGPNGIYICNECIGICADAMVRDLAENAPGFDAEEAERLMSESGYPLKGGEQWMGTALQARYAMDQVELMARLHDQAYGAQGAPAHGYYPVDYQAMGLTPELLEQTQAQLRDHMEQVQPGDDAAAARAASGRHAAKPAERPEDILTDLPTPHQLYAELSEHVVGPGGGQAGAVRWRCTTTTSASAWGPDAEEGDAGAGQEQHHASGPHGLGQDASGPDAWPALLDVPFAIADATTLTEAGYVGEDVENILLKPHHGGRLRRARGPRSASSTSTRSTRSRRKAENAVHHPRRVGRGRAAGAAEDRGGHARPRVPPQGGRKHPQQELIHIDTTNILFILGGAFVGLADIVAQRVGKPRAGLRRRHAGAKKHAERPSLSAPCFPRT